MQVSDRNCARVYHRRRFAAAMLRVAVRTAPALSAVKRPRTSRIETYMPSGEKIRRPSHRVSPFVGRELARLFPNRWHYDEATGRLNDNPRDTVNASPHQSTGPTPGRAHGAQLLTTLVTSSSD